MNVIRKGKDYERHVVKILSKAFPDFDFKRTGKTELQQKTNDIIAKHKYLDLNFSISIECKSSKKNTIDMIFFMKKQFLDYIKQAKKGKNWMLFLKVFRRGDIVVMPAELNEHLKIGYEGCRYSKFVENNKQIFLNIDNEKIVVMKVKGTGW